jgi:MoaA/NifB/PqqE/SkfB family radical SAM enzyme
LNCPFCYYRFKPKSNRKLRDIKADLIKAKYYYSLSEVDISGGEPLVHPKIEDVINFCKVIGLKVTVITNGICMTEKLDSLVDEWLISIHGTKDIHNNCVGKPVFEVVEKNLNKIKKPYRINLVINKNNFRDFPDLAKYLSSRPNKPSRVHFIMFNPFHEFTRESHIDFLANPTEVGPFIKEAIDTLGDNLIDSVVRYLPFCFAKGFEDKVCGMSQVAYDCGEWDWAQQLNHDARVRNEFTYYNISRGTVLNNKFDMPACRDCKAEFICDGIMSSYLKHFFDVRPQAIKGEKTFDPLHFKNLQEKRNEALAKSTPKYFEKTKTSSASASSSQPTNQVWIKN